MAQPAAPAAAPANSSLLDRLNEATETSRLNLTAAQKEKLAALKTARTDALGKSPAEKKPALITDYEAQARGVLTADQQKLLDASGTEPQLRFNFRYTKWADVLEWFAKESDLSLVLDAPPPGTFNYTDNRTYSPAEAIDLLNGVLSTKGYTLVRRNRMLLVINLRDGIPEAVVPRITLDELEKRGRYEYVSLVFPLEGRDPNLVNNEIKPLLGPQGKSVLLPQTKQIIVTDTAGIMRAIKATIDSIPKPSSPPAAAPAPPPELVVYSLKGVNNEAAIKVLNTLLPHGKFGADDKAEQLNAYVPAKDQEVVKKVLDQMLLGLKKPEKQRARMEMYPLETLDAPQIVSALTAAFPDVKFNHDSRRQLLVAWGLPEDQDQVKAALDKLGGGTATTRTRKLEVYPLLKLEPQATLTLMQGIVPEARLAVDPTSRSLIAVALPPDHQTIKSTLDQLQEKRPDPTAVELRYYPVPEGSPSDVMRALIAVIPTAKVTPDLKLKRLMVIATPDDHEKIQATIAQVLKGTPPATEKESLVRFPVTTSLKAQFDAVWANVRQDHPGVKLIPTTEPGILSVWGTPAQHELIKGILEGLKKNTVDDPTSLEIRYHPFPEGIPATLTQAITALAPHAQVTPDPVHKRLMVVAMPEDQEKVKRAIDQVTKETPKTQKGALVTYPVTAAQKTRFEAILPNLKEDMPELKIVPTTENGLLSLWATPTQHDLLKGILEELSKSVPPAEKYQLGVHSLKYAEGPGTLTVLLTLFPTTKITLDATSNRLMIWATPEQLTAVKQALEQIDSDAPSEIKEKFMIYPLQDIAPDIAAAALQTAVPKARVITDSRARTLIIFGRAAEQELAAKTLQKLNQGTADASKQTFVAYSSKNTTSSNLYQLISSAVPTARLVIDPRIGGVAVWATVQEHEKIATLVKDMAGYFEGENAPRLETYTFTKMHPTSAQSTIITAVPEITISYGSDPTKMNVWARPAEHKIIKEIVTRLEADGGPDDQETMVVYSMPTTGGANAYSPIIRGVPRATISYSPDPDKLIIWAKAPEHKKVEAIIQELENKNGIDQALTMQVYTLEEMTSGTAINALTRALPKVAYTPDNTDARRFMAWARAKDHEQIKKLLKQFDKKSETGDVAYLQVYNMPKHGAYNAYNMAYRAAPNALINLSNDQNKLMVWGRKADHDVIQKIAEMIEAEAAGEKEGEVVVYTVGVVGAGYLYPLVQKIAPKATLTSGADQNKLIVFARPEEHEQIKKVIERLEKERLTDDGGEAVVYSLKSTQAAYLIPLIQKAVPKATLTSGTDPYQLFAWGRPQEQELIQKLVKQLDGTKTGEKGGDVVLYHVPSVGAPYALPVLQKAVPNALFSVGADSNKLMVWAGPKEQEIVKKIVEQLESQGGPNDKFVLGIYDIEGAGASNASQVLARVLPRVTFTVGTDPTKLIAWANPQEHETIKKMVAELNQKLDSQELHSRVYRFKIADPQAAYSALAQVITGARFALDLPQRSLIVSATEKDHARIKATIEEMEKGGTAADQPVLRSYSTQNAEPTAILSALSPMFQSRTDVRMTVDAQNHAIIVLASPSQHEQFQRIFDELLKGHRESSLAILPLNEADGATVMRVVNQILRADAARVRMSFDNSNNQLIVVAQPQHLELIRQTIDRMQKDKLDFEAFSLDVLEPQFAEMAINRFLTQNPRHGEVFIDVDLDHQRLFVHGSRSNINQIRDLLVKMGENSLAQSEARADGKMRVIPFEGDLTETIQQIEVVWPKLRPNPLKVITPSKMESRDLTPRAPSKEVKPEDVPDAKKPAAERKDESLEDLLRQSLDQEQQQEDEAENAQEETTPKAAATTEPKAKEPVAKDAVAVQPKADDKPAAPPAKDEKKSPSPITIVPGEGRVTITSDDPNALDQLETILRSMSRQSRGKGGKDFAIFALKNVGAEQVEKNLRELFRVSGRSRFSEDSPVIVADERMNAILVNANRNDRHAIEDLIRVLDTAEIPDFKSTQRSRRISLKNSRAARIEIVLRDLYRTQMTSVGNRQPIPIPIGVSAEVATALQTMNSLNAGPLLTLAVDETTNSILVKGPNTLIDDVAKTIQELDAASTEDQSRKLSIIALKRVNSDKARRALDAIIDDQARPRTRSRSGSR